MKETFSIWAVRSVLIIFCFLGCACNDGTSEGSKGQEPKTPEEIVYDKQGVIKPVQQKIVTIFEGDPNYHPGGEEYKLPTEEEIKNWNTKRYHAALIAWVTPKYANTYCQTCKKHFNECKITLVNSDDRNNLTFDFECDCGYKYRKITSSE